MTNPGLSRQQFALILCAFIFILLAGIDHGIWRPDEPYVAGICSGVAQTHEFVAPMLNGRPFLEKPPLYYSVAGLSGIIFGPKSDIAFRLASLLFSSLTLLTVFLFLRRKEGTEAALISALVLATLWEFFRISRWVLVDISLVFGVTLAMFSWMKLAEETKPVVNTMAFGLAIAIAFMAKGMVGPGIIGAAVLADMIRKRDFRLMYKCRPDIMLAFTLLPVTLWVAALWMSGGWPYVREVLVVNNLMRFTGAAEAASLGHHHGIFYYFGKFPGVLMPWTLVFIPSFILAMKRYRQEPSLSWLIGPFILLSLASTKRALYLAPLLPACSILITSWLNEPVKATWERAALNITWGLVIAGAAAPFAGIFLGVPLLGIIAGFISIGALMLIDWDLGLRRTSLALTLSLSIVMSMSMSVYYKYRQPQEDYLSVTRQALAVARNDQIRIIEDKEILEGVLPMLAGHKVENVPSADMIKIPGYYLWSENKNEKIFTEMKMQRCFNLLLDKPIGHDRNIRLAYVYPCAAVSQSLTAPIGGIHPAEAKLLSGVKDNFSKSQEH
jgi:4-amino-4-deoxy-L-arabinose transferase-like glycosyltransferase